MPCAWQQVQGFFISHQKLKNMERKIKVVSASRINKRGFYSHSVSAVKLSGRWLEKAGFLIGNSLSVMVTANYIQIIKDTTPKGGENV
jgi:hypothetical protein